MAVVSSETVPVVSEADIVAVRRRVRETVPARIRSSIKPRWSQRRSELARNTLIHGQAVKWS